MKQVIVFFFILLSLNIYAQKPTIFDAAYTGKQISKNNNSTPDSLEKQWIQTAEVEFIIPSEIDYSHSSPTENGSIGHSEKLKNKLSLGALYTINYPVIKKLTLGALAGFQYQSQQSITALKLGGLMKYYFKDYENSNIYLLLAKNLAVNNKTKNTFGNIRLGLQFPIAKLEDYRLTLNGFFDYNSYQIAKPLLSENETPGTYITRGYGISLGIQF